VLEGTSFMPPTPEPERINSVELGFHQQWRRAALAITLFDNQVENYIHEVPTPDGVDEYFANSTNDWHMRGAEALLRFQPTERTSLRIGLANLRAKEKGDGDLPYLASWSGSLNLSYSYRDDHQAGVSLFYSSKRDDTNSFTEDDPDSFVTVNLNASGNIDRQWRYQFGVDNLFDELVYDPAGDFGGQYNTERSEREIWLRMTWSPSL
jgi:outer membrane cobalamin receptor